MGEGLGGLPTRRLGGGWDFDLSLCVVVAGIGGRAHTGADGFRHGNGGTGLKFLALVM